MKITSIKNPVYATEDKQFINFEIQFEETGVEWLPFTYGPNQPEEHFKWIENEWLSVQINVESIAPYVAPPVQIPQSVTRRQGRQALLLAGRLADVQPAIDAIADDMERQMAQIYWDDAQEFERQNATLISLAQVLGLTDEDVDNLFIQAAGL